MAYNNQGVCQGSGILIKGVSQSTTNKWACHSIYGCVVIQDEVYVKIKHSFLNIYYNL